MIFILIWAFHKVQYPDLGRPLQGTEQIQAWGSPCFSQCGIPCKVTWFLGHPFPLYLLLTTSLFTYVESETLLQSKVNQETSGPGTVRNQAQWTQHSPSHLGLRPKRADVHDTSRLFIVIRQKAPGREWPDADPKRVQIVISNIYAQMCSP